MRRIISISAVLTLTLSLACLAFAQAASTAAPPKPTAPPEPEGMVKLFNGADLTGWSGDPTLWSVKDGAIRAESTPEIPCKSNTFLIWKGGQPADFELRLSFRIDHGNSGVQYRSKHLVDHKDNKWVVAGYQAEVCNEPPNVGFLYHEKGRGSLVTVGNKVVIDENAKKTVADKLGDRNEIAKTYKKSDWNDLVIICRGNHVQQFLNGIQTIDLIDNDPKDRCMSGIIALQIHAGPPMVVEFKDIRLKEYPAEDKPAK